MSGTPLFSCGTHCSARIGRTIGNSIEGPSSIIVLVYRYKSGQHYERLERFAKVLSAKGLGGKVTPHRQSYS